MASVIANDILIEYDTFGEPGGRPLLLVMGLGAQMTRWRKEFCELLAAQGHYVIRFDNRDVGLSQKFDTAGLPDMGRILAQAAAGETVSAAYSLSDMANDAAALLTALDIPTAHVCGASLGGMVVQVMALEHGSRLRSMTSVMSTTGDPTLPKATPEAMAALMSPAGNSLEAVLDRAVRNAAVIGGPGFPAPEAEIRALAKSDYERCFYPQGVARQMAAVAATGNRRPRLEKLVMPTLVIHGEDDPLVPLSGGLDTHAAIPGASLKVFEKMGHNLPSLCGGLLSRRFLHIRWRTIKRP